MLQDTPQASLVCAVFQHVETSTEAMILESVEKDMTKTVYQRHVAHKVESMVLA